MAAKARRDFRLASHSPKLLVWSIASFAALSSLSCAKPEVSGFSWKGYGGERLAFRQSASWEAGREGAFGPGRLSNRYLLAEPRRLEGGRALELSVSSPGGDGSLRLGLALLGRDGKSILAKASFPLRGEASRLVMNLDAPSEIGGLALSLDGLGDGGSAAQATPQGRVAASVDAIAEIDAFRGYAPLDSGAAGARVSSGFSLAIEGAQAVYGIDRPFANCPDSGGRRYALVLELSSEKAARLSLAARSDAGPADELSLQVRPGASRLLLCREAFPESCASIELRAGQGVVVGAFRVESLPEADCELVDLGVVLRSRPRLPGADYDLYRWNILPTVLVLDFADYQVQDLYLKRLAFFVEKAGYRGTLQPDSVIGPLHGWNAHDYRPEDLAAFFRAAKAKGFPLNAQERALFGLLVGRGILAEKAGGIQPGSGALISISRESPSHLRRTFIVHESIHGIFFADRDYRAFVTAEWKAMDEGERWFWKRYFQWMVYDTASEYLMANEYQAYLLQQPLERAAEYFTKNLPANLLQPEVLAREPGLDRKVELYMEEYGGRFEARAAALEAWLKARYGISAGRDYFVY